ncbi:uncharacterized protein LOC105193601 [Solenopsis invicta]|uniref:uncharacterized protein LOC105193601 n=1 Tax=Solenopsis invicta TaxID=13686 RepID=UPI0005963872|nr:uncharacterized protein LOC105193601 [Solenopsis invicta]
MGASVSTCTGQEGSPLRCVTTVAPRWTRRSILLECSAWEGARLVLTDALDLDKEELSLERMVRAMLSGTEKWEAATSFCEEVISQKENAEREREREREQSPDAAPMRRRRKEQRARVYARAP